MEPVKDRAGPGSRRRATRDASASLVTEESVYGTLLVSGLIVVAGSHDDSSWEAFVGVLGTVIVIWVAHVYAGTVAGHHGLEEGEATLGVAFRRSLRRSMGFLIAALIPLSLLLIGTLRIIEDDVAMRIALWLGVLVLGAIGYRAFASRGSSWTIRILGSICTASLGVAMILLQTLVH
jgi:hypothetical protein